MVEEVRAPYFLHQQSGIVFVWNKTCYEPIAYDGTIDKKTGEITATEIVKGDVFYDFIAFIRFSSMIVNKRTGDKKPGSLDIYQWHISFVIIRAALSLGSQDTMCAISRQAGKTYVSRKAMAFLMIFGAHHLGERLVEDRYYITFCGVKKGVRCVNTHPTEFISVVRTDVQQRSFCLQCME